MANLTQSSLNFIHSSQYRQYSKKIRILVSFSVVIQFASRHINRQARELMVQETEILRFIRSYNSKVSHWWEKITGFEISRQSPNLIIFFNSRNKEVLQVRETALPCFSRRQNG